MISEGRAARLELGLNARTLGKRRGEPTPLITIVTATYNAAKHIETAIDSMRRQTFTDVEWIVIDGASKDATVDILRQNEDVIDYWLSEPDNGIYDAWNKGVREARGEWILFLGADDYLWTPEVLTRAAAALGQAASRVVYGTLVLLDPNGDTLYSIGEPWAAVRKRFSSVMCLPHPATFHRRELFLKHGAFDTSFRIAGDYEFLLRELPMHEAMFVDDLVVTGMSVGGVSSSPVTSRKMLFEMRRATRKNGYALPGWPWMAALLRLYARQVLWGLLGERMARKVLDNGRRLIGKPAHWTRT